MKRLVTLLAAVVLCTAFLIGMQPRTKDYRIADGNRINFGHLLSDLLDAYENLRQSVREIVKLPKQSPITGQVYIWIKSIN